MNGSKWISIPPGKAVPMEQFPDFFLVGPQRTGTTWLFDQLSRHPEVLMSPRKETYFFSQLRRERRALGGDLTRYLALFRDSPLRHARRQLECRRRFGEDYRPRVRGEATATYAAMAPELIDEIVALQPGAKAILLIRDPVERAWSHARKDLAFGRDRGRSMPWPRWKSREAAVSDAEYEAFFRDPYQLRCGGFTELIATWEQRLQPGRLLVRDFSAIARAPETLLLDIFGFLGITPSERYLSTEVRTPVNSTSGTHVPDRYRRSLEQLFSAEIARLDERRSSLEG